MKRIQKILTIIVVLFCMHAYMPLVAGLNVFSFNYLLSFFKKKPVRDFNLIEQLPPEIWEESIIHSSIEKSFLCNEALSNLCNIAQGLFLGNDKHVGLADYTIKRILALDKKVNKEEGLVNFYQILDEAQVCLFKDPRGLRPSRQHCKRRINHRCLFCSLLRERKLHDGLVEESSFNAINDVFFQAAKDGNLGLLKMLLFHGIDINMVDNDNETALHWAAYNGRSPVVEFLVRNGADINVQDFLGFTPLTRAVQQSRWLVARFLVDNNADVNIKTNYGDHSLNWAMSRKTLSLDLIVELLDKKSDVNFYNNKRNTPLFYARKNKVCAFKLVSLLQKYGANLE